uniref:Uncharacterized protein n=1 Tax=Cacopsylla melanoneura TaxID=428564 RepID=A0A8D9F8Z6_9HEMI
MYRIREQRESEHEEERIETNVPDSERENPRVKKRVERGEREMEKRDELCVNVDELVNDFLTWEQIIKHIFRNSFLNSVSISRNIYVPINVCVPITIRKNS